MLQKPNSKTYEIATVKHKGLANWVFMLALQHFSVHVGVGTVVGFIAARELRVEILFDVSFNNTLPT